MKIITWNINGIRAYNKSSILKSLFDSFGADIICLQETKITRNLLTEDIANVDGYLAFFSFSRKKGGYSGVATYCKQKFCPISAEEGITGILQNQPCDVFGDNMLAFTDEELKDLDAEGRAVITVHETESGKHVHIFNLYCPRADIENEERYKYKMNFYACLEARCKALIRSGKHVIVAGDLNVSHKRIDHCDPDEDFDKNVARVWFDQFLNGCTQQITSDRQNEEESEESFDDTFQNNSECFATGVLMDTFRKFHPDQTGAFTAWSSRIRARETNYGTRIDYILADKKLAENGFLDTRVRQDIDGSDHCPVESDLSFSFVQCSLVPDLCAINMPEVCGKQQRIKSYFTKKEKTYENIQADGGGSCTPPLSVQTKRKNGCNEKEAAKRKKIDNSRSLLGYFGKKTNCEKTSVEENKKVKETDSGFETLPIVDVAKPLRDRSKNKNTWKSILKGPEPAPLCSGHKEKCVLRTVKKEGPNVGRQFYICHRPAGHNSNREASCNFFLWKT